MTEAPASCGVPTRTGTSEPDTTVTLSFVFGAKELRLTPTWARVTWPGPDDIPVTDALRGVEGSGNADITGLVQAVYQWDAASQSWKGYFPMLADVSGANTLATLRTERDYWVAVREPVTWAVAPGSPPGRFTAVSSGWWHTCALLESGEPVCWGAEPSESDWDSAVDLGQVSPPPGVRLTAISSGAFHTCGLRTDGTAVCWGAAEGAVVERIGQVGHGQTSPPEGEVFVAISSGGYHTCALRVDGTAACWGADYAGQSSPPAGQRFKALASGGGHTCGLREDGKAVCWGPEPSAGDYGGWEETPEYTFVAIEGASGYTCGLREKDGIPVCWGGYSDVGMEGDRPNFERFTTITIAGGPWVRALGEWRRLLLGL